MLSTYQHQHVDYAGENTTFIRKNNLQCAWGQPAEKNYKNTAKKDEQGKDNIDAFLNGETSIKGDTLLIFGEYVL